MIRVIPHLLLGAAILGGLALAWELRLAILVVLIAVAVAAGMQGPIDGLTARRVPHGPAVLGVFLLTVGALGGVLVMATPSALEELEKLASDARDHYARHAEESPESPLIALVEGPPAGEKKEGESPVGPAQFAVLSAAWMATSGAVLAASSLALVLVIAFYWLLDRARFERLWLSLLTARQRPQARSTWRAIEHEVGAYVRSEVVQAVLAGMLLWVGFRLLGHPYPTLAALLAAVAWSSPWVGTLLTIVVVGAMTALGRSLDAGGPANWDVLSSVLFATGVLLFLEGVVERRLFDRGRYNSLLIAFVSITLADLYGVWWILLGPPLAVVIQIAAGQLWRPETTPVEPGPESVADRVHALQATMATAEEVPADLANLVARLGALVDVHHDRAAPQADPSAAI
jgi:putative permease